VSETGDDMNGQYVKNFKVNYPLVHIIIINANYEAFNLSISNSNFSTVATFESFKIRNVSYKMCSRGECLSLYNISHT